MRPALLALAAAVTGCAEPAPASGTLRITDTALPRGIVHAAYDVRLRTADAEGHVTWALSEGALPEGLVFNPTGRIGGTPTTPSAGTLQLRAEDQTGEHDTVELNLFIDPQNGLLGCGGSAGGTFEAVAVEPDDGDLRELDWSEEGGWSWVAVALPDDDTQRVSFHLDAGELFLAQPAPGTVPYAPSLPQSYQTHWMSPGSTVTIDRGTAWNLDTYQRRPQTLTFLVAGLNLGEWGLTMDCTDAPVFQALQFYPVEVGAMMDVNFNVYGDNAGVSFSTTAELPDWMSWEAETGRVRGRVEEADVWSFPVIATDAQGRQRTEQTAIATWESIPLSCDDTVVVDREDGYYMGDLYAWRDPRGWAAFDFTPPATVSAATIVFTSTEDERRIGLAKPLSATPFYIDGESHGTEEDEPVEVALSPESWPSLDTYRAVDDGAVHLSGYNFYAGGPLTFATTCDHSPRPTAAALPTVPVGETSTLPLTVTGGTGPYTWSAEDTLPGGVTLDADGALVVTPTADLRTVLTLAVTDSVGATGTGAVELTAGAGACEDHELIRCGETLSGVFTAPFDASVDPTPTTSRLLCLPPEEPARERVALWVTTDGEAIVSLELADPGRTAADIQDTWRNRSRRWIAGEYGEVAIVSADTIPARDVYADLPLRWSLESDEPGAWSLSVDCVD